MKTNNKVFNVKEVQYKTKFKNATKFAHSWVTIRSERTRSPISNENIQKLEMPFIS